jgi:hypothetical protein
MSTDVACIGAGKTVTVSAADQAGVVQGEGALVVSSGSLEVAGALEASRISALTLSGGALSTALEFAVSSSLTINGKPTIDGAGSLVLKSGGTGQIGSGECSAHPRINGGTFVNDGTVTFGAGGGTIDGAIFLENGGHLTNAGTFNVDSVDPTCGEGSAGYSFYNGGGAESTVTNFGSIKADLGSGRESRVGVAVVNTGNVSVQTGKFELDGGGSGTVGTWSASSGASLVFGGGTFSLTEDELSGAGSLGVAGGSVTATGVDATGAVSVSGGTLTVPKSSVSSFSTFTVTGGTLSAAGELAVSSSLTVNGKPTISGGGSLVLKTGGTGQIGSSECSAHPRISGATFVNDGTVTFGAGGGTHDGAVFLEKEAHLTNAGTFNVDSVDPTCLEGSGGYSSTMAVALNLP